MMLTFLQNVPFILVFAAVAFAEIGSGMGWFLLLWAGLCITEYVF